MFRRASGRRGSAVASDLPGADTRPARRSRRRGARVLRPLRPSQPDMDQQTASTRSNIEDRTAVSASSASAMSACRWPWSSRRRVPGHRLRHVREKIVKLLNRRRLAHPGRAASALEPLVQGGHVRPATTDRERAGTMDAISICRARRRSTRRAIPDMSYVIMAAAETLARTHARPGSSSCSRARRTPARRARSLLPQLEQAGLKVGRGFLPGVFSPSASIPAIPVLHTKNTPKVVGGITPACIEVATRAVRARVIDTIVPVSSTEAAELVKLLENTFRVGEHRPGQRDGDHVRQAGRGRLGGDRGRGHEAVRLHEVHAGPGHRRSLHPARPALPRVEDADAELQDALHRSRRARSTARCPRSWCEKVAQRAERRAQGGERQPDPGPRRRLQAGHRRRAREPGARRHRLLEEQGAVVTYHDPARAELPRGRHRCTRRASSPTEVETRDAVVIVTDHKAVDYQRVVDHAPLIVDARNATRGCQAKTRRVSLAAYATDA